MFESRRQLRMSVIVAVSVGLAREFRCCRANQSGFGCRADHRDFDSHGGDEC